MLEISGREVLIEELTVPLGKDPAITQVEGFKKVKGQLHCTRCGTSDRKKRQVAPCTCGKDCYYCVTCLQMGKIKRCSILYTAKEQNLFASLKEPVLTWEGELSKQQKEASLAIVETIKIGGERFIWAVAGAGKTEMIFKGIELALQDKKRVCIASPRVDVCLELAPRLKKAFQHVPLAVLYGGSDEAYCYTQLVIATTHQLLRFNQAFDVLIIDEVDAFPFNVDQALQYAAKKAKKQQGALIFLSATPSKKMQRAIQQKKLTATMLPARYHGYRLPEPQLIWCGDWQKKIRQQKKISVFFSYLKKSLDNKRRTLIFLPNISLMQQVARQLEHCFPDSVFTTVYAQDPKRKEKIIDMRQEKYDFLLTTTILERGVTFKDIDVMVLGAEDRTFTESALVQIAGRAGRHRDFPNGEVLFFYYGKTRALKRAVQQIKRMNRLAMERGLVERC
ncbi:DEAD/DEAH box helicase [Carnobacterium sp. TMP28]|uniref:DEAD/DEAH box helicase n=1 Tax=Carnobacterium sp. TMP28 TaxID=3397060 RepID=UPI0039E0978F